MKPLILLRNWKTTQHFVHRCEKDIIALSDTKLCVQHFIFFCDVYQTNNFLLPSDI